MNLPIDKNQLKKELEFSKSIIDSISSKRIGAVDEVLTPKINEAERSEMTEMGDAVAQITGMDGFKIKFNSDKKNNSKPINEIRETKNDLLSESLSLLKRHKQNIPNETLKKVLYARKKLSQCEKFLLHFVDKYR